MRPGFANANQSHVRRDSRPRLPDRAGAGGDRDRPTRDRRPGPALDGLRRGVRECRGRGGRSRRSMIAGLSARSPRLRGDDQLTQPPRLVLGGRSPRVRGTQRRCAATGPISGSIPAPAGNIGRKGRRPAARGPSLARAAEAVHLAQAPFLPQGRSPRVRGNLLGATPSSYSLVQDPPGAEPVFNSPFTSIRPSTSTSSRRGRPRVKTA